MKEKSSSLSAIMYSVIIALVLLIVGCVQDVAKKLEEPVAEEIVVTTEKEPSAEIHPLVIHFLDVGQGDSILLTCDSESMLIDAGDNSKGTFVQNYLLNQGIKSLKFAVGTHPDADHIGGLDVIITKFDVGTVLMPSETKDTATYRDVVDALEYKELKKTIPQKNDNFTLGDAEITVLAADEGSENDSSIVLLVEHGENTFLFTGDAGEDVEKKLNIQGNIDVLKVGHHGSYTASSEEFMKEIKPAYAVISCGKMNEYGHPHAQTLNRLLKRGTKMFRTDEQGSIMVTSDGVSLEWNCAPCIDWTPGEERRK